MIKTILQILGIASFFIALGYVLTYPYELSYKGDHKVLLIEESYEFSSLDEIINRAEFENKTLYITNWEPFDSRFFPTPKRNWMNSATI